MKTTHAAMLLRVFPLLAALCLCAAAAPGAWAQTGAQATAAAQSSKESAPTPSQKAQAEGLRRSLAGTLGDSFEVARARLTRRSNWHGGGLYWLAHLRAKRSGGFHLRYKYRYKDHVRPKDPLYTFVEHETFVRVGERGCERQPRYNYVCVGDTIILPVVVNDYTEHAFSLAFQPLTPGNESLDQTRRKMEEAGLYHEAIPNPAAEFLKYLGGRAHYSAHRSLGYTMSFHATFEAARPGSFNLALGVAWPGAPPPSEVSAGVSSIPVVVVERGTPITVLSSTEKVHGYTERFSSNSGNNYLTTPIILQPGDRLTLQYHGFSKRGEDARGVDRAALEASVKERPPAITLLPFRVDTAHEYNEWVAEFLPPARRK